MSEEEEAEEELGGRSGRAAFILKFIRRSAVMISSGAGNSRLAGQTGIVGPNCEWDCGIERRVEE
jgi:hypothetical protein